MAKSKEKKESVIPVETPEQAAQRREKARKASGHEKKPGAGFGAVKDEDE